jgi:hypothetical protein
MIYTKTTFMVSCILSKLLNKSIKTTSMVCNPKNGEKVVLAKIKINPIIFSNYTFFCFLFKLLNTLYLSDCISPSLSNT